MFGSSEEDRNHIITPSESVLLLRRNESAPDDLENVERTSPKSNLKRALALLALGTIGAVLVSTQSTTPTDLNGSDASRSIELDILPPYPQLEGLSGQSLIRVIGNYEYTINFFKDVTRKMTPAYAKKMGKTTINPINLGTINNAATNQIFFSGGAACEGNHGPTTNGGVIKFLCSSVSSVFAQDVVESPACYYNIFVAHKSFCEINFETYSPSAKPTTAPFAGNFPGFHFLDGHEVVQGDEYQPQYFYIAKFFDGVYQKYTQAYLKSKKMRSDPTFLVGKMTTAGVKKGTINLANGDLCAKTGKYRKGLLVMECSEVGQETTVVVENPQCFYTVTMKDPMFCDTDRSFVSFAPVPVPTEFPISIPVDQPTEAPVSSPTVSPVYNPTFSPLSNPTAFPISSPTVYPSANPTLSPVANPSASPLSVPTTYPISTPTLYPVSDSTVSPVSNPTDAPVADPTAAPAADPTNNPVAVPSESPIATPTFEPVADSTPYPNADPTPTPTSTPISEPTEYPIAQPSGYPIAEPSDLPVASPTEFPISNPTAYPIPNPTAYPITAPTDYPISDPTAFPIANPTAYPISTPTAYPIADPTKYPIAEPTLFPVAVPSEVPTNDFPDPIFCPHLYTEHDGLVPEIDPNCALFAVNDLTWTKAVKTDTLFTVCATERNGDVKIDINKLYDIGLIDNLDRAKSKLSTVKVGGSSSVTLYTDNFSGASYTFDEKSAGRSERSMVDFNFRKDGVKLKGNDAVHSIVFKTTSPLYPKDCVSEPL